MHRLLLAPHVPDHRTHSKQNKDKKEKRSRYFTKIE
jgi:hypothetical protein